MWLTIIVAAVLGFYIYSLEKRLLAIEETRGRGYSHRFVINSSESLSKNRLFMKMIGIKSSVEGKEYENWTKEEKDKWHKYPKKFADRLYVTINYLVSENAYLISTHNGTPYIVHRDDIGTGGLIYSAVVVGDEEKIKEYMEFNIYERLISNKGVKNQWVITPCFRYKKGIFNLDDSKFEIICDFPHLTEKKDEELKNLGFEIKRDEGDVYEDDFGEMHSLPVDVSYIKNGTTFTYTY